MDVLGRDFSMLLYPLHERSLFKAIKTTIQSGNVWHGEIQQRTKHARFFWTNTSIVPFLDASGKPYQFVAISTDITQHREAEAALRQAHEELESRVRARTQDLRAANRQLEQHIQERKRIQDDLFEAKERAEVTLHSMGEGVITTDAGGKIEFLNPVAEALTGWPMSEAKGQRLENVLQLYREDSSEAISDPMSSCLARGAETEVFNDVLLIGRDGKTHTIQNSVSPIRNLKGETLGVVMVLNDITESRRLVEQMSYQATHDSLTGLVNRREFECRIEHALAGYREHSSYHSLCYLDLDQFKLVNDTAGHAIGDRLLQQIAKLLLSLIRERDTLARLGGDEFGLLLNNCRVEDSYAICEAIVASVRDFKFTWENRSFQIGVSVGVAPITADIETPAQLLSQADVACYTAKDQGRNQVYAYRSENGEPTRHHGEILRAAELKNAIIENRFCIYLQPLKQLNGLEKTTLHYEVLLRLIDQCDDVLLPSAFISAAERFGLIGEIDRWVLHTAFALCRDLLEKSDQVQLAINLSGHSLSDDKLFDYICRQHRDFAIPADAICFEITETAAVHSLNKASGFVKELKMLGFRFALDDFGTGLSSFRYLKKLPVDYLKIDGSFVQGMVTDSTDHSMVEAIHQIGCKMGLKTIAEYAETAAIVEQLRKLGVDFAQGFALGYPVPAEEML